MKAMWRGVIALAIGLLMLGEDGQAASLPKELQRQEVIFLLDSSQSMLESDPLKLIPETALEMCAILPGRYSVGLYSYNDGGTAATTGWPEPSACKSVAGDSLFRIHQHRRSDETGSRCLPYR